MTYTYITHMPLLIIVFRFHNSIVKVKNRRSWSRSRS